MRTISRFEADEVATETRIAGLLKAIIHEQCLRFAAFESGQRRAHATDGAFAGFGLLDQLLGNLQLVFPFNAFLDLQRLLQNLRHGDLRRLGVKVSNPPGAQIGMQIVLKFPERLALAG